MPRTVSRRSLLIALGVALWTKNAAVAQTAPGQALAPDRPRPFGDYAPAERLAPDPVRRKRAGRSRRRPRSVPGHAGD